MISSSNSPKVLSISGSPSTIERNLWHGSIASRSVILGIQNSRVAMSNWHSFPSKGLQKVQNSNE